MTDVYNLGIYNYYNPKTNPILHGIFDVLPYLAILPRIVLILGRGYRRQLIIFATVKTRRKATNEGVSENCDDMRSTCLCGIAVSGSC